MPLSRFQLKSEYGLGVQELYSEASKREDPKAVLDGVAVAGLVGLLRQLGDLAEFAADIFHGLQEQMTNTASRSRKLVTRVKRIEAALPPLEKAMLSQRNHIHYAYTPGFQWHARIRNEQNHFIYTDLPRCIMDSYEECREPPSLLALDKFDTGGPGSCLKRYSDPTFFRKASGSSDIQHYEKSNKKKKARKTKKRRSSKQSSQFSYDALKIDSNGRVRFSSLPQQQQSSPSRIASTFDMTIKSDLVDRSDSHGSGDGMGFIECVFHTSGSVQADKIKNKQLYPQSSNKLINNLEAKPSEEQTAAANFDNPRPSISEKNGRSSSTVTWDEKAEIFEPMVANYGVHPELPNMHETSSEFGQQETESAFWNSVSDEVQAVHEVNFQFDDPHLEPMEWDSGSYEVPKVQKTKFEPDGPDVEPIGLNPWGNEMPEGFEKCSKLDEQEREPIDQHAGRVSESHEQREPIDKHWWGNGIAELQDKSFEFDEQEMSPKYQCPGGNEVPDECEKSSELDEQEGEPIDQNAGGIELPKLHVENSGLDELGTEHLDQCSWGNKIAEMHDKSSEFDEQETEFMYQHPVGNEVPEVYGRISGFDEQETELKDQISWGNEIAEMYGKSCKFDEQEAESIPAGNKMLEVCPKNSEFDEQEMLPVSRHPWCLAKFDVHGADLQRDEQETDPEIEVSVSEGLKPLEDVGSPESISYKNRDDEIESETENFVDALNTIESESENDVECQTKGEVEVYSLPKEDSEGDVNNEMISDDISDHSVESRSPLATCNGFDKGICNSWSGLVLPACEDALQLTSAYHDISGKEPCENRENSATSVHSLEASPLGGILSSSVQDVSSGINFSINNDDAESLRMESAALNTIEPESENDVDCQTKGEVEVYSHPKADSEGDANNQMISNDISDHSVQSKSPLPTINDFDKGMCNSWSGLLLPACEDSLQLASASHDISGKEPCENRENSEMSVYSLEASPLEGMLSSSIQDVSSRTIFTIKNDYAEGLQMESAACESPCEHLSRTDEGIECSHCASQQDLLKYSDVAPVAFWTNGGMLGLQPSKPPDFSSSDGVDNNGNNRSDYVAPVRAGPLNENLRSEDDYVEGKLQSSANRCDHRNINFKQPALFSGYSETDTCKELPRPFSDSRPDRKLNSSVDSGFGKGSGHSLSQLLPCVVQPETNDNEAADVRHMISEAIHADEERSFMSGFCNDFPTNRFRRSRSMGSDERHKYSSFQKAHGLEIGPHVTLSRSSSGTNLPQELPSSDSAPPSPLLEHMKISFHPFSSFETSKLKLIYPDRTDDHDEILDAFPSFQLVPESTLQHSIGSESDDDTFCRTNPCMSDDEFSHLSDSNSEFWESDDSLESRGHMRHNGLCRVSPGEFISSSFEHEELSNISTLNGFGSIHGEDMMGSSPFLDIPLLQAMDSFRIQESKFIDLAKAPMETSNLLEPTPGSPPLPPMQWMGSKHQTDASENKESPHHAKVASDHMINTEIEHMYVTMRNKHLDELKLKVNVEERVNEAVNKVDAEEDFLHQIRTKSFNLRKTELLKPTPTPVAPATNVKVAAILEKANAIRKAVASDDGDDDDPWCDTGSF